MAYKFLAAGRRGPLTHVAWPPIGDWLTCDSPVVGKRGAHVCTAEQLAHWLHDELWEVEIAGVEERGLDCVVVERARLVRRIDGWNPELAMRFAKACVERARAEGATDPRLTDADASIEYGYPAVAAYIAAVAIARDDEAAYATERRRQSEWIVRELDRL